MTTLLRTAAAGVRAIRKDGEVNDNTVGFVSWSGRRDGCLSVI
jgi:hypothetical protein